MLKILTICSLALWTLFALAATSLHAQQPQKSEYDELDAFLPGDDDARLLIMMNCTVCHSAASTKDRISRRAGGDITYWTNLVRRMITTWNARIDDEDVEPITIYLAKYFGPSSKPRTEVDKKEPNAGKKSTTAKKTPKDSHQ